MGDLLAILDLAKKQAELEAIAKQRRLQSEQLELLKRAEDGLVRYQEIIEKIRALNRGS